MKEPLFLLIKQLKDGKPLIRSAGLNALAQEAVQAQKARKNEDIEAWANRIADDVSTLVD